MADVGVIMLRGFTDGRKNAVGFSMILKPWFEMNLWQAGPAVTVEFHDIDNVAQSPPDVVY